MNRAILEYVARLGGATPDHLAALIARTTVKELSTLDSLRIHRRVQRLARSGALTTTQIRTSLAALRSTETWLYDVVHPSPPTPGGDSELPPESRRILDVVEDLSIEGPAAEEDVIRNALDRYAHRRQARWRLSRLVDQGWLEKTQARPFGRLSLVTLTPQGHDSLVSHYKKFGRLPPTPTRPPRIDQSVHHLLVVEASVRILAQAGAVLKHLHGDESIRSLKRKGRASTLGMREGSLPDGRLYYRKASRGGQGRIDIEILVSKYSDAQIRKKVADLAPLGTLFLACSSRLCDRTEKLTGQRPILLN